ncbi:MAG: nucleotidyltransferase domain-containing protein [Sedimentisphaerales bacterium]|nr:nucleotidyltransferase domain-containing protein [Sedimentisphaerales bacterium]MBN2842404.1 nucleotidyltransferase domain-containing protein [Sedimentisphaerales bacterium]
MIKITGQEREIITAILQQFAHGLDCMAFGSRVTGTAKSYSDLDLVIINDEPMDFATLGELQDSFAQSDLPFRVDILQWSRLNEDFKQAITPQLEKIN